MKTLILISGTMGIGKSTLCQQLKKKLDHSVFLDGDWCWDMHPFIVNEETKEMVMNNICFQINSFLKCSSIDYVIFGWVMHQQDIIDDILGRIDLKDVRVCSLSLVCSKETLTKHIQKDIDLGIRSQDVLERSLSRLEMYQYLNTIKIDITDLNVEESVQRIYEIILK